MHHCYFFQCLLILLTTSVLASNHTINNCTVTEAEARDGIIAYLNYTTTCSNTTSITTTNNSSNSSSLVSGGNFTTQCTNNNNDNSSTTTIISHCVKCSTIRNNTTTTALCPDHLLPCHSLLTPSMLLQGIGLIETTHNNNNNTTPACSNCKTPSCQYCKTHDTLESSHLNISCNYNYTTTTSTINSTESCMEALKPFEKNISTYYDPTCRAAANNNTNSIGCIPAISGKSSLSKILCRYCTNTPDYLLPYHNDDVRICKSASSSDDATTTDDNNDSSSTNVNTEPDCPSLLPSITNSTTSAYYDPTCAVSSTADCFPARILCRYCSTTNTSITNNENQYKPCPVIDYDAKCRAKAATLERQDVVSAIYEPLCSTRLFTDCMVNSETSLPCRLCHTTNNDESSSSHLYSCSLLLSAKALPTNDLPTSIPTTSTTQSPPVFKKDTLQTSSDPKDFASLRASHYVGLAALLLAISIGAVIVIKDRVSSSSQGKKRNNN